MSKRVLITGGASGLGKALAEQYLKNGDQVLITDVHRERGEQTVFELRKLGNIQFQPGNTTLDEDWKALVQWVEKNWGGIDVVVNNAGVAAAGRIDTMSMDDWDWIIDINLKGVVRGCRAFTPMMKQQGYGQFINIASLAAVANAPAMSSYNVTKSGVVSLSETMRHELAPYGIRVSVVCPSFFQTNLAETMRSSEDSLHGSVRKLLAGGKLSAGQVAEKIIRDAQRNRFMILPHLEGKALYLIKRFAPFLYNRGLADASRKMKKKLERH